MLEDTLIEHAHTKPLLPSQLIRYREVQVPDGKWSFSVTFYLLIICVGLLRFLKKDPFFLSPGLHLFDQILFKFFFLILFLYIQIVMVKHLIL